LGRGNFGTLQHFLVAAIEAILDHCPAALADRILPSVINNLKLQT
jgi:hypothetical protein